MNHDQPKTEENIEKSKVEWGPEIGEMNRSDYQHKVYEAKKEGWRVPTPDELLYAFKNKISGFEPGYYWSTFSENEGFDVATNIINMRTGEKHRHWAPRSGEWGMDDKFRLRFVRDIE